MPMRMGSQWPCSVLEMILSGYKKKISPKWLTIYISMTCKLLPIIAFIPFYVYVEIGLAEGV